MTDEPTSLAAPHDLDTERAVLCAALLSDATRAFLLDETRLPATAFYGTQHRLLWEGIEHVDRAGQAVDVPTVLDAVQRANPNLTGDRLGALRDTAWAAAASMSELSDLQRHSEILRDLAERRSIMDACWQALADTQRRDLRPAQISGALERRLSDAAAVEDRATISMADAMAKAMRSWEQPEAEWRGLATGYRDLDSLLRGLRAGQLVVVGARPGVGKSVMALDVVRHVALREKGRVLLVSLEMSDEEVATRYPAAELGIKQDDISLNKVASWEPIMNLMNDPGTRSNIELVDRSDVAVEDVASIARAMKRRAGLDLVVVDYLQLLRKPAGIENQNQQITIISRALKVLAGQLDVPIIALSQLKRIESRRPRLDDLRDSGSLEQDANIVVLLHQDDSPKAAPGIVEVIVAKNRNGPKGETSLLLQGVFTRFQSAPRRTVEPTTNRYGAYQGVPLPGA